MIVSFKHREFIPVFLILTLAFVSCNEQGSTAGNPSPAVTYHDTPEQREVGNIFDKNDEVAASPAVIRSKVVRYNKNSNPDTSQVSQYIRCIFQDRNGALWFGTVGDGVCRYDGSTLTYYSTADGFSGTSVQDIKEDKNGNLWFATNNGISVLEINESAGTTQFKNYSQRNGLHTNLVFSLLFNSSQTLWAGTEKGVNRYDSKKDSFIDLPLPASGRQFEIRHMTEARGGIWIATNGGGVYYYNGTSFLHFSEKDGLGNNNVHACIQDRYGMIWFATVGGGLSRYDPNVYDLNKRFRSFREEKGSNEVWRVFEEEDHLWVAMRGRLRCYNLKTMQSGTISYNDFTASEGLTNVNIQSIFKDRSGNLWIGSGAGLFRLNRSEENYLCRNKTCNHDLTNGIGQTDHKRQLALTFINVNKKGPWPKHFR